MGGKSKSVTVGYKYYLGMHHILCHGPIDKVSRVTVDDRIVWSGEATGGAITVSAESIFGGDSREGGVSGTVDIEMGGAAQGQNSYLVGQLGSDVPAYRGVVGAVLRQCYLGNNPYLKAWRYRGQRIHTRQNGLSQWYDDTAEIIGIAATAPLSTYTFDIDGVDDSATTPAGAVSGNKGYLLSGVAAEYALVVTPNLSGPYVAWSPWGTGSRAKYSYNVVRNEAGSALSRGLSGEYDSYAEARAAYMSRFPNGTMVTGAGSYRFYFDDTPTGDNSGGLSLRVDVYPGVTIDMNPVHIIRECLTDPDWGMGYTDGDIDEDSFVAAADTIYGEGLGISLVWDRQIKLEEFIGEVLKHIDGALFVSRTTGKFCLKLIRADFDEETLLVLDESNILQVSDPSRVTFGEIVNSVTVNYWDAQTGKDSSLTVTDTAMVQMQGAVINTTVQYPGFTNPRNATIAGQRDLRSLSSPSLSCTIVANSDASDLNIGDVFRFSWGKWQVANMVMRVAGIAYGTGRDNRVRITCTQDVFGTPATLVISTPGPSWSDPSAPPSAIPTGRQIAFEAPYLELVQASGQGSVDSELAGDPSTGYVMAAAARPTSAINARIWLDSGAGYEDAGSLDFCPSAELAADVGKTDTSFLVTGMDDLDEVTVGTHFQIGDELVRVDAIDIGTGTLTVGRGVLDTVPQDHLEGDVLLFWDMFSGFSPTVFVSGEEVDVKITPATGSGELALADAPMLTVTMAQRAWLPYPPGDLKVNGTSYNPGPFADELTITWAHRDRKQQTSGTLADHFDGSIGPEEGTTYRVRGYIDNVLSHTEDDIAGTSATWTPSSTGTLRVEVDSKRDGVRSWQAATHEFEYGDGPPVDPYWHYVAFLMYGEGADGSTTFTDRSRFARTATAVGGAVVDTDITVGSSPSILLGADGRHVRRDHGYEININSDAPDFCMEAYVYCTDVTQNNQIFGRRRNSDNYIMAIVNNVLNFSTFNGTTGTTKLNVAAGLSNNTVHHVAVIRVGTTYYGFVDGVLKGSNTSTTGQGVSTTSLYIGESESDQSARYWRGNVNWCRITIGHQRYDVAGFTPPTLPLATARPSPVSTPSATFSNVKLLCGFNGTDAATAFTDESAAARVATFVGNAQLDTAQSKFGTASLLLDGTGDYITFPDNADLKIPTAAGATWTLEAWVRATGSWKANATIASKRNGSGQGEFTLGINSGLPNFFCLNSGTSVVTLLGQDVLALDEWHHIALSATSGFYRLFANGILVAFGCRDGTPTTSTTALHIGRDPFNTGRDWAGWIDEVRYTRDQALYTEDFIPPASAFPRS